MLLDAGQPDQTLRPTHRSSLPATAGRPGRTAPLLIPLRAARAAYLRGQLSSNVGRQLSGGSFASTNFQLGLKAAGQLIAISEPIGV
jgi:hypothetical protein